MNSINNTYPSSPKEVYDIVMECLNAMEKKVDAAFGKVNPPI